MSTQLSHEHKKQIATFRYIHFQLGFVDSGSIKTLETSELTDGKHLEIEQKSPIGSENY